jgi:hypothetical protein
MYGTSIKRRNYMFNETIAYSSTHFEVTVRLHRYSVLMCRRYRLKGSVYLPTGIRLCMKID